MTAEELAAEEERAARAVEEEAQAAQEAKEEEERRLREPPWMLLESKRPWDVDRRQWEGLFEYVVMKLSLLLGPHHALPFAKELLEPKRWKGLRPEHDIPLLH